MNKYLNAAYVKNTLISLEYRHVVNTGEKISFAKYRDVVNSEASELATCRYSRVITVFLLKKLNKFCFSFIICYDLI